MAGNSGKQAGFERIGRFNEKQVATLHQIAMDIGTNEIYHATDDDVLEGAGGQMAIHVFHCEHVQAVVRFLRENTSRDYLKDEHDVLKIIFGFKVFSRGGVMFEVRDGHGGYIDVMLKDWSEIVEVKSIHKPAVKRISSRMFAAYRNRLATRFWIFFFYKLKDFPCELGHLCCKYLLTWIDIYNLDHLDSELISVLIEMVEKSKSFVAKDLGVEKEILIPVDGIILVEDLEAELESERNRNSALSEKLSERDKVINDLSRKLSERDKMLSERDKVIDDLRRELSEQINVNKKFRERLASQQRKIDGLRKEIEDIKRSLSRKQDVQ